MATAYELLLEYEKGLRLEATKVMGIEIPIIHQNTSYITEILFLEQLLHINGFGEIEKKYRDENLKEIENLFDELRFCNIDN